MNGRVLAHQGSVSNMLGTHAAWPFSIELALKGLQTNPKKYQSPARMRGEDAE